MKGPIGCFGTIFCENWRNFFKKNGRTFWCDWSKTWPDLATVVNKKSLNVRICFQQYCKKHVKFSHFSKTREDSTVRQLKKC
jgi:hypothetical protein